MELHYVIVSQAYGKESDTWDVIVVDKPSYDRIVEAIASDNTEELCDAIECWNCLEPLCEDYGYEEAKQVAFQYADDHLVTLIAVVSCDCNSDGSI